MQSVKVCNSPVGLLPSDHPGIIRRMKVNPSPGARGKMALNRAQEGHAIQRRLVGLFGQCSGILLGKEDWQTRGTCVRSLA